MTDYERGVEDASNIYKAVIREYVAENAKLREERREYQATIDSLVDECTDHKAENAKLRELVVTLMACVSVDDCDKCPINGAEFKVSEVRCCREAKQRMQELGIEVYG